MQSAGYRMGVYVLCAVASKPATTMPEKSHISFARCMLQETLSMIMAMSKAHTVGKFKQKWRLGCSRRAVFLQSPTTENS